MATREPRRRKPQANMNLSEVQSTVAGSAGLETDVQTFIGKQLRAVYDEILNEPVPDKLIRLLDELERKKTVKP